MSLPLGPASFSHNSPPAKPNPMSTQPDPTEAFRAVAAIFGTYATENQPTGDDSPSPDFRVALTLHKLAIALVDLTNRQGNPLNIMDHIRMGLGQIADLHPTAVGRSPGLEALIQEAIKVLAEVEGGQKPLLRSTVSHGSAWIAGRLGDYLEALSPVLRDGSLVEGLRLRREKLLGAASMAAREMDPGLFVMRDLLFEMRTIRRALVPSNAAIPAAGAE